MTLSYTGEKITNPDGVVCEVLDTSKLDFNHASFGRKSAQTLVKEAKGGEQLHTRNKEGQIESTYVTQPGDAIFVNLHNEDDSYVPGDANGIRWQFSELQQRGFEAVANQTDPRGVLVKNTQSFKIFHEIVDRPTCVKDSWGPGAHAFLYAGATLKDNGGGRVTGIDKGAFDATWEVLSP